MKEIAGSSNADGRRHWCAGDVLNAASFHAGLLSEGRLYFSSEHMIMNINEENIAPLKDLMTVPPITATQHAAIMRKKNSARRRAEDLRDRAKYELSSYGKAY